MSAAVNDRPHEIVPAVHLPLTGELHPLRREFARWLATGNVITITLAVVICASIYFWPRPAPDTTDEPRFVNGGIVISPRPIPTGHNDVDINVVAPSNGKVNYEPTEKLDPVAPGEVNESGGEGDPGINEPMEGTVGGNSSGPIDIPAPPAASDNGAFIAFDTAPVLLSIEPPVYPQMVREAGIDGTVMVRVFIALNGHVKDAYAVDGPAALREAALASARTGFFKPALQGTHPVEVWVVIPITFQLHERY